MYPKRSSLAMDVQSKKRALHARTTTHLATLIATCFKRSVTDILVRLVVLVLYIIFTYIYMYEMYYVMTHSGSWCAGVV